MRTLLLSLALLSQIDTSITGVVMKGNSDVAQPLTDARIELLGGPSRQVVRTDSGGRFAFSNILPGNYRLSITRDGFIRQEYAVERLNDFAIVMLPAATIAGAVRDDFGGIAADVLVQAFRRTYDLRGRAILRPVASVLTDDRGQYRLYWLDPGNYVVIGSATYYPGFDDPGSAETIRLRIGREVRGVDFKIVRSAGAPVDGLLVNGAADAGATVTFLPPGDVASEARYQAQATGGQFTVPDVAPGTYIVSASQNVAGGTLRGYTTLSIRNMRLAARSNLRYTARIVLGPDVAVTGRIRGAADFSNTSVLLTSIEPVLPSPARTTVQSNGAFSISRVPAGEYALKVIGLPEDVYIEDAVDFVEVRQGEGVPPLDIQLAADGGRVQGTVSRPSQVVLVPDADRRARPSQYRIVASDPAGNFTIRGVPPGAYKIFAWESLEANAYLNADFVRNYEDRGIPLQVAPGQRISIQVPAITEDQ